MLIVYLMRLLVGRNTGIWDTKITNSNLMKRLSMCLTALSLDRNISGNWEKDNGHWKNFLLYLSIVIEKLWRCRRCRLVGGIPEEERLKYIIGNNGKKVTAQEG